MNIKIKGKSLELICMHPFFGKEWHMCSQATSMFMTNSLLLWWTLESVVLQIIIKPKVVQEALQSQRRAQVQSYIN